MPMNIRLYRISQMLYNNRIHLYQRIYKYQIKKCLNNLLIIINNNNFYNSLLYT